MLGCWVGIGSADLRALGIRPALLRAGAVVAATGALVVAIVPVAQTDAVEISLLDVAAGTAFVRTPGGRTAVLVTADDAFGLTASVGQRLRGLAARPEIVVAPAGATAVTQLLERYPADHGVLARASAEDVVGPGSQIDLGDSVSIWVVDVRSVDERVVLDLAVLIGDTAIWLPGRADRARGGPISIPQVGSSCGCRRRRRPGCATCR